MTNLVTIILETTQGFLDYPDAFFRKSYKVAASPTNSRNHNSHYRLPISKKPQAKKL